MHVERSKTHGSVHSSGNGTGTGIGIGTAIGNGNGNGIRAFRWHGNGKSEIMEVAFITLEMYQFSVSMADAQVQCSFRLTAWTQIALLQFGLGFEWVLKANITDTPKNT